jgi:hypothetical protein
MNAARIVLDLQPVFESRSGAIKIMPFQKIDQFLLQGTEKAFEATILLRLARVTYYSERARPATSRYATKPRTENPGRNDDHGGVVPGTPAHFAGGRQLETAVQRRCAPGIREGWHSQRRAGADC